jgi:predicted ATP-grasp superfamily ATP-dependent carboligase
VAGGVIPLVNKNLYEKISDKHSFADLCMKHGILVPAEFDEPPSEFPFVAKPLKYSSINGRQLKPYLLYNEKNWLDFSKEEVVSDFYYQEFIYGHSIYLLMYISRNGTVTKYSQENLIQQACGGSIILAKSHDFHETDEAEKYIAMLKDVKYFGLIMIEVRFCQKTNRYIMIEANPRIWGPMQFLMDNKIDLLGELLRDFFKINIQPDNSVENVYDYYFWSGGLSVINSPFAFHNFSQEDFIENFKNIVFCDVFCRDDTISLYKQELKS